MTLQRIAILGPTGFVGTSLLAEAVSREGIAVTAVARDISKLLPHPRMRAVSCDVNDVASLTAVLSGHDCVVHAVQPPRDSTDVYDKAVAAHRSIIAAVKAAGISRLLCVGGAASLKTPEGIEYIDSPLWDRTFDPYKPAILATRALYYILKDEKDLDWVVLAPSVMLRPGSRTGNFRSGLDHLLFDDSGNSRISMEDFCFAMIEEIINPVHHRQRFTVGY